MPNIKNSQQNRPNTDFSNLVDFIYFIRHTNITILSYTSYPISSYKKRIYPPYPTATFTIPSSKKTATSTPPSCKVYKVFFFSYCKIYHKKPTLQKCSKPSAEPSLLVLCRSAAHFRYKIAIAKLQSSTTKLIINYLT